MIPCRFAKAKGHSRRTGKTDIERAYGDYLQTLLRLGTVLWYDFESVKLRLADNTFYTPDYFVIAEDGVLEAHECKGFWEDDARVKIKVAAERYPFRFIAVTRASRKNGGAWIIEKIPSSFE